MDSIEEEGGAYPVVEVGGLTPEGFEFGTGLQQVFFFYVPYLKFANQKKAL